jgi:hypothetical protein
MGPPEVRAELPKQERQGRDFFPHRGGAGGPLTCLKLGQKRLIVLHIPRHQESMPHSGYAVKGICDEGYKLPALRSPVIDANASGEEQHNCRQNGDVTPRRRFSQKHARPDLPDAEPVVFLGIRLCREFEE